MAGPSARIAQTSATTAITVDDGTAQPGEFDAAGADRWAHGGVAYDLPKSWVPSTSPVNADRLP